MPSRRDAALAWAARGFRVFPLQAGTKVPLHGFGWTVAATTDAAAVYAMWTDPSTGEDLDHNIGVLTNDLVVLDVDTKKNKPGLETFMSLGLGFDTLVVRTPSGGLHTYYWAIGRETGNAPLGDGLDVRSYHGYVAAPGSMLEMLDGDGEPAVWRGDLSQETIARRVAAGASFRWVEYEVELDLPVAEFPHELRPLLKAPRARRGTGGVSVELDRPENIELAAHWLNREAPIAIQGLGGDRETYKIACRVRDFGLTEGAALDLMLEDWNARCEPPWDASELQRKVENAFQYATGEAGSASPEAMFGDVVDVPLPSGTEGRGIITAPGGVVRFGNMMEEASIPPRPWVVEGLLMERHVSLLAAPGGAGKSLVSLVLAAHLAVGKPLWGYEMRRPGKSIVFNAEDDLAEVSRRLISICAAYDLPVAEVSSRVALLGSESVDLQITKGSNPPKIRQDHVDMLAHAAADPEVVMLAIDPLIEVHTGKEADSVEMRYVMGILRTIARHADVPVLVVQHTPKSASGQTSRAGDQDAARGSTAITAAARVVLTMFPATEAEAVEIGAPRDRRRSYVRVDGAKVSYGPGHDGPLWLRWISHELSSGDHVGVLVEHDAKHARAAEATRWAARIARLLRGDGSSAMPLPMIVGKLNDDATPLDPQEPPAELTKRLQRLFVVPAPTGDGARVALRTGQEGLRGPHFMLV